MTVSRMAAKATPVRAIGAYPKQWFEIRRRNLMKILCLGSLWLLDDEPRMFQGVEHRLQVA